jgi:hypothetical protein
MNKIFFIFILFFIIYIFNVNISENFDINLELNKSEPIYYNPVDYQPKKIINCCLVQKKYLPDSNNILGGNFKYVFQEFKNENCDFNNYIQDNNKQLFIDGYNSWSNKSCNNNQNKIGSCRNINKECIDFVDKQYCDKYKMIWSNKTCQNNLEYKWIDKIKFIKPIPKDDGSYIMFNKKSII